MLQSSTTKFHTLRLFACGCELTNGLERHVGEHGAEVVVEKALEDVHGDVRQAGVDVGVDGQNDSVRSDNSTCDDVTLKQNKHTQETVSFSLLLLQLVVKRQ